MRPLIDIPELLVGLKRVLDGEDTETSEYHRAGSTGIGIDLSHYDARDHKYMRHR